MRIASLELAPYGHLTKLPLQFRAADGGPGLHVLTGRNGAGKSTTLRALDGALFGIKRRTPDTHTHPGPALRVAITLEGPDGRSLSLERRKKETQSLSTPDGTVVEEAKLREFLGGLPPEEFRAMFLLDCEKLEQGSEDLVAGRGLLGEALFGAALGLGGVHKILEELDGEADELWVKGGQRLLNRQLKALGDARKAVRARRLAPDAWVAMGRELQHAEEELDTVRGTLTQHTEAVIRSERHERCLAPLGRRRLALERLQALPAIAEVPATLPREAREHAAALKRAEQDTSRLREELQTVNLELLENPDPGAIAQNEDAVNALYKRAGEISKATSDLPRRQAELDAHLQKIRVLHARARPSGEEHDIQALRISDAERALVDEYATQRPALDRSHSDAAKAAERLTRRLEEHERLAPEQASTAPAVHDELAAVLDSAGEAGDLDSAITDGRAQTNALKAAAERENAALTHWDGTVEELERLKVPSAATIERFAKQFTELERTAERLDERDAQLATQTQALKDEQARLSDGPEAPLRNEITAARRVRDDAISALIETPSPEAGHPDVVLEAVRGADDLADSRAEHGEAAAAREHLERDRAALKDAREQTRLKRQAHAENTAEVNRKWAGAWSKLRCDPGTVEEMELWSAARERIVANLTDAREQEAVVERSEKAVQMHIAAIVNACDGSLRQTSTLTETLRAARALAGKLAEGARDCAEHQREQTRRLEELTSANEDAAEALEARAVWDTGWRRVTDALGLPEGATPQQAKAQLACIDELLSEHDGAGTLRRRIDTIEQDQQDFTRDARELARELAAALSDADAITIADTLHADASKARGVCATRAQLEPRTRELSSQLQAVEGRQAQAQDALQALATRAGVSPSAIEQFCETVDARAELREQHEHAVSEIEAAGAQPAAELEATLADATPEGLAAVKADAEAQAAALELRRGELEQTIGRLHNQLEQSGSDEAALAAERESQARAEAAASFDQYSELRLAAHALRSAMERHRREHQGPLLKRAGELFAALSANRMIGLRAITSEREPYLMGVLPDDREVPVEDMSTGQRHQLFLALRLASLERHFATGEPMPIVLDDLLVQLDDTSARAALTILSEIARSTQVLFFTHHDHLLEMARETVPANLLVEHQIAEESQPVLRAA